MYKEIIQGYELLMEIEKDSKKRELYQSIIDGYEIISELKKENKIFVDNTILKGDIPKYITPLIKTYIQYCRKVIGISNDVQIDFIFEKTEKNEIGFVNFSKMINGKNEIVIDANASYKSLLSYLSHELTHIKQIQNKELDVLDGYFIWKGKKDISIKQYNLIVKKYDFQKYKELKWEKEAYSNQATIIKNFKNSNELKKLLKKTTEPNLKFILDNAI